MKITVVSGSIRETSQSDRIAKIVQNIINELDMDVEADVVFLKDEKIPLWDEGKWKSDSEITKHWKPISDKLKASDGFVIVTPEWAGMAPPHLKNFLLMCEVGELAHKPAQIVSVSSGMGGAYPVSDLRVSGSKNNMITWLPDHIILRNVTNLFIEDEPTDLDAELLARIKYSMTYLAATAEAWNPVRDKYQNRKEYKFGM
ncbi:NADPH-dependent FMN reductase [Curvivirga aplysinae]|uniref:NADPH-dependent FMN reductase n=1 Tax=Curvivirga aplysinae TaxID=2529852 RepID=UPI0012BC01FF|nr:NAD(P)H-dependent oxidoreductase [Curvivirga aplysinae]MTI10752.1 NADPH-dependent oxidoreductase [Curvivirga aplysinae]